MDDNISKGLFGLNRKDVELYIAGIKSDYEAELKKQNTELLAMKAENAKLNERLNEMLNNKKSIEEAKANISEVLIKAEQQAKAIIEDAKNQAIEERQEIDTMIETEKELKFNSNGNTLKLINGDNENVENSLNLGSNKEREENR